MTNSLLKINGTYGAYVGHRLVFTKEGALERYKLALEVAYNRKSFSMSESLFLTEIEDDLYKIGFTYEELEEIELEYLKSL